MISLATVALRCPLRRGVWWCDREGYLHINAVFGWGMRLASRARSRLGRVQKPLPAHLYVFIVVRVVSRVSINSATYIWCRGRCLGRGLGRVLPPVVSWVGRKFAFLVRGPPVVACWTTLSS